MHFTCWKMQLTKKHIVMQNKPFYHAVMQKQKRVVLIPFIFMMIFSCVFCQEGKIKISKIKVFQDDVELEDSNQLSTILSYTKLRENKAFTKASFEKEIICTKLRLMDSGLFYTAEVESLPSRKNPGTFVVYISVRTGFLLRFGGDAIYGMFGKVSFSGNRDKLLGYAGYNKNGLSYVNENTFGIPLVLGGAVFTNLPEGLSQKTGIKVEGQQKTGWFITPDLQIGNDTGLSFLFDVKAGKDVISDIYFSPYLFRTFFAQKVFAAFELRYFNLFSEIESGCKKFSSVEGAFTVDYSPVPKVTLAGMLCSGFVCNSDDKKISLEKNALTVCDGLGLSNRGVRSAYLSEELKADYYALCSMEVRFTVLELKIPPAFPCDIVPFVFTDLAVNHNHDLQTTKFLDAYGIGLEIDFECPVFAYFNFSYGVNHQGKGKFIFAAMQSF